MILLKNKYLFSYMNSTLEHTISMIINDDNLNNSQDSINLPDFSNCLFQIIKLY